jgi:glutathione S-transferase
MIMRDLHIIGGPASNYVWMVRIACAEKGVPYALTSVMPHTPEVDAIHPLGKIPAMRHGDVALCESRAICAYIDRVFDGPPLVPADPVEAAQVEQWVSIINTAIDPVWIRQYVGAGYIFPGTPDKSPNRVAIEAALPKMQQQFPVMDKAVASGHLVGEMFTLADMNLIPILYYMNKFPESSALLAARPRLTAYLERHARRKSVQETMPQSQPGTAGSKSEPADVARAVNA